MADLTQPLRQRPSITTLDETEKQDLLFAMHKIQHLDPSNPESFFYLASIHGLSSEGNLYWYCHHKTVLFPSWHRPYMLAFEQALRNQLPEDRRNAFALPFWDQTSEDSLKNGTPGIFLEEKVHINGIGEVDNPLRTYTFQADVKYGSDIVIQKGERVLRGFTWIKDYKAWVQLHRLNVSTALRRSIVPALHRCLDTKEWALFSNTYNEANPSHSLESPHNSLHNYPGGMPFLSDDIDWNKYVPAPVPKDAKELIETEKWKELNEKYPSYAKSYLTKYDQNPKLHAYFWVEMWAISLPSADAPIADPAVSAFDPLFWFHHNNMERFFWHWQGKHPGDFAPPVPAPQPDPDPKWVGNPWLAPAMRELATNTLLTMDTKLAPFSPTTREVWDRNKLTYTYPPIDPPKPGDLDAERPHVAASFSMAHDSLEGEPVRVVHLVNEATGEVLGAGFPFVRRNPAQCAGCKAHPLVTIHVPIAPRPPIPLATVHTATPGTHFEAPVDIWPPPLSVFVNGVKQ